MPSSGSYNICCSPAWSLLFPLTPSVLLRAPIAKPFYPPLLPLPLYQGELPFKRACSFSQRDSHFEYKIEPNSELEDGRVTYVFVEPVETPT